MKKNLVVIQPFNTIEDKEGVFKQDFFQFKFLDMELQNRTSVPLNIKKQIKNRKLISGVKLPDLDQHNNKLLQKIERSESLRFISKQDQFYQPRKSLGRSEQQEQVLENIRLKMEEPGYESNVIAKDIAMYIQKFENANCFD